jgi:hypothetical protein
MVTLTDKMRVFDKALENKGIDVKRNSYLTKHQDKNNPFAFVFGENYMLIYTEQERIDDIIHSMKNNFEYFYFSFNMLSQITNSTISEVENYFLADVLLENEKIYKENNNYFTDANNALPLIERKIRQDDFIKKYVFWSLEQGNDREFIEYSTCNIIDGLYVYDVVN